LQIRVKRTKMGNWLRIFFAIFSTSDDFNERKIFSLWPLAPLQFYFDFKFRINQSIPCDSIVKIVYAIGRAHNRVVTSVGMVSFIFVTIWVSKRRVSLFFFITNKAWIFDSILDYVTSHMSMMRNSYFSNFSRVCVFGSIWFKIPCHLGIYNKDFIVLITNMVWVFESVYVFNTIWIPKPCKSINT